MTLTLVPLPLAAPGRGFTFNGPGGAECEGCPVRRLCFGLAPGRRYEVARVRDVVHPCAIHEGGRVRVVEVREAPFRASLETRHLRGTAAAWAPPPCAMPECPNYGLCHPVGPRPGRHAIAAEEDRLDCPAGYELAAVRLLPMEA